MAPIPAGSRGPSPARPPQRATASPPKAAGWRQALKQTGRRDRFSVFNRDVNIAKAEMLEVLGNILKDWGDNAVYDLPKMRYEEIFHKTRDVLTELAQLCYTQENLIQNLKGDLEDSRKQAEATSVFQLLAPSDKLAHELEKEKSKNEQLREDVAEVTEKCRIMSMEQNETKHSLTSQLQECQTRIDEGNEIASTILSRLVEKDLKIDELHRKLEK
ncbi:hypothetical protein CSUI_004307 [Cystoisospora suis]|uniref:Uncharacterized protein n=1 Tax=Cystoisospora suis TaxID=483139 RepID=A0A2C6KMZ5_9APIC|nr:hypothetical protein CSUI_004307 [Cystoisospora suis]